jgi:DNA-binding cell septation regulator SpoVG
LIFGGKLNRLVIGNTKKFKALPQEIQDQVNQFFIVKPTSSEEAQEINNAILEKIETANFN